MRVNARAVVDAAAMHAPGSLLVQVSHAELRAYPQRGRLTVLAVGSPEEVNRHPAAAGADVVDRPGAVIVPGMVNAHAHLDLTHIGPRPFREATGFVGFVDLVRCERAVEDEAIAASVRAGIDLSLRAGVVAVGDIAGAPRGAPTLTPWRTLRDSAMRGVSFVEFFSIGKGEVRGRERVSALVRSVEGSRGGRVRLGLEPHAPNTVSLDSFRCAVELAAEAGLALCTHLSETPEEREFIQSGSGPQRQMLESLGLWDDAILRDVGRGLRPVEHLASVLAQAPFLAVHVNFATDADLETLARTGTCVAYCPRASAYFGAERHFGPHRYREMLKRGIPVALGTDSIINLPAAGLSVLDEMRFLHRRDGTDPRTLLAMATVMGAAAIGEPEDAFVFKGGSGVAGVVAIETGARGASGALADALSGAEASELLLLGE